MQRLLLPQGETKAANLIHVASKILNLILINRKTQNAMQNAMQCAQLIWKTIDYSSYFKAEWLIMQLGFITV
jgi:hypothetical protein